jgi:hypothetical protein
MVGVPTGMQDLHDDLAVVLVHGVGDVTVNPHLHIAISKGSRQTPSELACLPRRPPRLAPTVGDQNLSLTSSGLVSLAAKGVTLPARFGAIPPVTIMPTPFFALIINTRGRVVVSQEQAPESRCSLYAYLSA